MQLANNQMSTMHLLSDAFISSQEDSLRYNQVKGREMTGYFTDNHLSRIKVEGNGQTVYYIRNGQKQLTGVNKADCSNMMIYVEDSKVKRIALINKPDATLFPIKELPPQELKLKNFMWYGEKRPLVKEDIFDWIQ